MDIKKVKAVVEKKQTAKGLVKALSLKC